MNKDDLIIQQIKELLDKNNISYEYLEHEPTPTSEDSARVRGTKIEEGVKALILRTSKSKQNFMVILPGYAKMDSRKIKEYIGEDFSFENPEVILEKYGIIIGGVPPFWNLINEVNAIDDYGPFLVDSKIFNEARSTFNCGKRTCSIIMQSGDFKKVINGVDGNWSK
jgi:nondiscriminating aspartyl-tRNA synthetase